MRCNTIWQQVFLAKKIVMGVPFYGLEAGKVWPTSTKVCIKSRPRLAHEGYNHLEKSKRISYVRDPKLTRSWLFNSRAGVFWSFDDPVSLAIKMSYARRMQLGGVMFWELSGDDQEALCSKRSITGCGSNHQSGVI